MDASSTLPRKHLLIKDHLFSGADLVSTPSLNYLPKCKRLTLKDTNEFQITLIGNEIDSLGSKATYEDLTKNLLFLEFNHTTLSSLFTTTPCNLGNNSSTLSNSQSV